MDLSFLKWPILILVIVGGGWLVSEGGINYMINRFSQGTVGQDEARDRTNELGLSRIAGFLIFTFRYEKADQVLSHLTTRHTPDTGAQHYWHNLYRLALCKERLGRQDQAVMILRNLAHANAHQYDDRVPGYEVLRLRAERLMEAHGLGETGQF